MWAPILSVFVIVIIVLYIYCNSLYCRKCAITLRGTLGQLITTNLRCAGKDMSGIKYKVSVPGIHVNSVM